MALAATGCHHAASDPDYWLHSLSHLRCRNLTSIVQHEAA
jgi:hypothetical protein